MRQSIRFIAMLFGCFAIYLFLPSCHTSTNFTSKTGKNLIGPILITNHDAKDSSLKLLDSTNNTNASYVQVSRNMPIIWVNKDSKIEILSIDTDANYHANAPDFFSVNNRPQRIGNSPRWRAEVGSPDTSRGILLEKYFIRWQLKSTGKIYRYDPLLQLNPY